MPFMTCPTPHPEHPAAASVEGVTAQTSPRHRTGLSGRSPLGTLTGVRILATGSYAPEQVVRNEDLAELGYDADWIVQRTGILERRHAPPGQATSDVACEAAVRCLQAADVSPAEVDLILLATMTPDSPMPTTACLIQQRLGCVAPALEMNAACSGFMYALVIGAQFVKTGCSRRVLVIGVDLMSRSVNPVDKRTYPLFGDGGGAALLGPGDPDQGLLAYTLGSEGDHLGWLCQPAGGTREPLTPELLTAGRHLIHMEGRPVFKWAVRVLIDSSLDVLRHAQLSTQDMDWVVFHQANIRIIDAALNDLDFDRQRVIINLDRYGNTSAGSMPLALDELCQQGRIQRGDHVMLSGFGGGLSWGTAIVKW
ncbi:MAG: ketoacyl-ACP synthase III [Candidatus Anammoximicrobium sp.]|nr:ketoacyl-ACP synthase III [Candidatus Anammoximicrobium sp.]